MPTTLGATTFISDSVVYIRDTLATGVTDPISATRPTNQKFVMTTYPNRVAVYPLITVKPGNITIPMQMGFRQVDSLGIFPIELRVWARSQTEKDKLSQQAIQFLRNNQYTGAGGTTASNDFGFFDFKVTSMVDVDEDGDNAIKSKVIGIEYKGILTP